MQSYTLIARAIIWNSINVFTYKVLLSLHQIALFMVIPHSMYAKVGIFFSTLYLLIGCTNGGFDSMLFALSAKVGQTKLGKQYIFYQAMLRLLLLGVVVMLCILYHTFIESIIDPFFMSYFILLFISESSKKYAESCMQILFLNKEAAFLEICFLLQYIAAIWIAFFWYEAITIDTLLLPMIITSWLEVITLACFIVKGLKKWNMPYRGPILPLHTFVSEQGYHYINQICKNIFSPNFIFLYTARFVTLQQTALIRLITHIITLAYMVMSKVIALPTGALLASMVRGQIQEMQIFFLKILNGHIQFLYAIILHISSIMAFDYYLNYQNHQSYETTTLIILIMLFAGSIEYIPIIYEKLYIVHHQAFTITRYQLSMTIIALITLYILQNSSITISLTALCIIRSFGGILLGRNAYYQWQIIPQMKIQPITIFISLSTSLLVATLYLLCFSLS